MMPFETPAGLNPDFQMAIYGLPVELRYLQPGCIYWVTVQNQALSLSLLRQVLNHTGNGARGVLISDTDPNKLIEGLTLNLTQRDIRLFQLGDKLKPELEKMTRSLDRHLRPKERTIVLCLAKDRPQEHIRDFNTLFEDWQHWLHDNGCTLLIMACCHDIDVMTRALAPQNEKLSGLSSLLTNESGNWIYQVEHWRSSLKALCAHTFTLRLRQGELEVIGSDKAMPVHLATNQGKLFLFERTALNGVSIQAKAGWQVFDTRQALVEAASTQTNATVIFGLQSTHDLTEIALILHRLRKERGPYLKLVLYELGKPLRHLDEQRILDCGATLVIPTGTPITRFLSMLEEIQPLIYTRQLAQDPELVFGPTRVSQATGIVTATEFIDYLVELLAAPTLKVPGVLVALKPVPGLTAQITLQELNLKRFDDVACTLDQQLYIFLYGCHPDMVGVALSNLFKIDYTELFTAHAELMSREEIEGEIQRMRFKMNELNNNTPTDFAAAQSITADHNADVNANPWPEPSDPIHSNHRYAPQRLTLNIKSA